MSESQSNLSKPKIEIQPSDPKLWEKEDQDSFIGLFKLLIEIDMKNNPENYKLQSNQANVKSYESNNNIRNSNSTSKA
jgi:hypothetical protein